MALVWPEAAIWQLGLLAVSFCYAVELSQLIEVPWLDQIRGTLPGRLILGSGFLWSDLACYAVGVILAAVIDSAWLLPSKRGAGAKP